MLKEHAAAAILALLFALDSSLAQNATAPIECIGTNLELEDGGCFSTGTGICRNDPLARARDAVPGDWKFGIDPTDNYLKLWNPNGDVKYQKFEGATEICIGEDVGDEEDPASPWMKIVMSDGRKVWLYCQGIGKEGKEPHMKVVEIEGEYPQHYYDNPIIKFKKGTGDANSLWEIDYLGEEDFNDGCSWYMEEASNSDPDPTPAPVQPTPAPVNPTPSPVDPTPAPVVPTPAPVDPTPAPVNPTPAPATDPTPAPTPAPVTPAPVTPAPVTPAPTPTPVTPAPVTPAPVTAAAESIASTTIDLLALDFTDKPSVEVTDGPTLKPTPHPTPEPTPESTAAPSPMPSPKPTSAPTSTVSDQPSASMVESNAVSSTVGGAVGDSAVDSAIKTLVESGVSYSAIQELLQSAAASSEPAEAEDHSKSKKHNREYSKQERTSKGSARR